MGAIVYGVSYGEYSDYRVAAIFESEEKAREYIADCAKPATCLNCHGTGENDPKHLITIRPGDDTKCYRCKGTGTMQGDGYDYEVEEFPWNP